MPKPKPYTTKRAEELEHGDVAVSLTSGEPAWWVVEAPRPYDDTEHLAVFVQDIPGGGYHDRIMRYDEEVRVQRPAT